MRTALLLTAAVCACARAPQVGPADPAGVAAVAGCPTAAQAVELFRGARHEPAVERSSAPDSLAWEGARYVPYGSPVPASGTATSESRRIVRVGFIAGSAVFAAPDAVLDPEALFRYDARSCVVQEFRREQCTRELRPGISVRALDLHTSRPPAHGYAVTARSGAYTTSDSIAEPHDWQMSGWKERGVAVAHERAGTYEVEVRARGYHPWRAGNIQVLPGRCHVESVVLDAYLVPASR